MHTAAPTRKNQRRIALAETTQPTMPSKGRQKRRVASEGLEDGGKNYQALQPMQRILEHRFIDRQHYKTPKL
jgi:hypothetical protein